MNELELRAEIIRAGLSIPEISKEVGLNKKTFYEKLTGKTEFKASEIRKIANILNLSDEQMISIFFAKEVA